MSETGGGRLVVIGLGNPLMADDGLGIAALERLRERWSLPESVQLVDGGTWGMNLLPLIEAAGRILFLDAVDAGRPAGTLIVLEREDLPLSLSHKLSPHQIDLREALAVAELRGALPAEVAVIGLQPGRIEMFVGLGPELESRLDELLEAVVERLERWGCACAPVESAAGA